MWSYPFRKGQYWSRNISAACHSGRRYRNKINCRGIRNSQGENRQRFRLGWGCHLFHGNRPFLWRRQQQQCRKRCGYYRWQSGIISRRRFQGCYGEIRLPERIRRQHHMDYTDCREHKGCDSRRWYGWCSVLCGIPRLLGKRFYKIKSCAWNRSWISDINWYSAWKRHEDYGWRRGKPCRLRHGRNRPIPWHAERQSGCQWRRSWAWRISGRASWLPDRASRSQKQDYPVAGRLGKEGCWLLPRGHSPACGRYNLESI